MISILFLDFFFIFFFPDLPLFPEVSDSGKENSNN